MTRIRASVTEETRIGLGAPFVIAMPSPAQAAPAQSEPSPAETEPPPEPAVADPVETTALEPVAAARTLAASPSDSLLRSAGPILIGLLILAVVLLGLAAIPPSSNGGGIASLVEHRRMELSLIGMTVLAAAIIGLIVALLSR
jgi:hypothetical protein